MWSFAMYKVVTELHQNFLVISILFLPLTWALLFRVDQFTDVTERCKSEKKLSYILNEDKPAMYISIDPNKPKGKMKVKKRREVLRHDEIFKKFLPINQEKKEFNSMNTFNKFDRLDKISKDVKKHLDLESRHIKFENHLDHAKTVYLLDCIYHLVSA